MTTRYLLIRGRQTSLRLVLPSFGVVSIGRSQKNTVIITEPGVEEEHLNLHLDYGIGVELLAGAAELQDETGQRRLPPGITDITQQSRLIIGAVEARVEAVAVEGAETVHSWAPAPFQRLVQSAVQSGASTTVLCARLNSEPDIAGTIADLGDGEYALLLPDDQVSFAIERLIESHGKIEIGRASVQRDGADAGSLLAIAQHRMKRVHRATLVAESPAMRQVVALADQVAESTSDLLIQGETGTGKNLLAQRIHSRSSRAQKPLVQVSCVNLLDTALEGTPDFITQAGGGTVLLDEVGGLSPREQLAMGHVLQRWSCSSEAATDDAVRFIATSNQDLTAAVEQGTFRKDLLYRLGPVTLRIPPLASRTQDIQPLAEQILMRADKKLSEAAARQLESHDWPGNVRELKNVLERALIICEGAERRRSGESASPISRSGGVLEPEHLPQEITGKIPSVEKLDDTADTVPPTSLREEIAALERKRILEALDKYPNQTEAAKALDIPIRTFTNRMDALGIPRARKPKK